jgi:protein phosphatase
MPQKNNEFQWVASSKTRVHLAMGVSILDTAVVQYSAAAVSDRGRKRASNEDAFGYSIEHGVYVVCDGMGGAAAGEIASSLAVDEVMRLFSTRAADTTLETLIDQAIAAANEAIYSRSQMNSKLNGMGTTMVALVVDERRIRVLNIGDSRCYRLRGGHLEQISQDHSLVDEQVRLGRMTQAEALRSPLRNVITRALGTQNSVTADIFAIEVEPGDLFLLCSDGLTRELPDSKIEALLAAEPPATGSPLINLCNKLVESANHAGGGDNITCLLLHAQG